MNILSLWKKIYSLGITDEMPTAEKRRYIGLNQVIFFGMVFCFIVALYAYFKEIDTKFVIGASSFVVVFIINFIIMSQSKLRTAYHFTIIWILFTSVFYNSFRVPDLRSYFVFIPIAVGIYNIVQDKRIIRLYNISFFVVIGFNILLYVLSTDELDSDYLATVAVFVFCLYLLIYTMIAFRNDILKYLKIISESKTLIEEGEEMANMGNWQYDIYKKRLTWSEKLYEMFGQTNNKKIDLQTDFLTFLPDDYQLQIKEILQKPNPDFVLQGDFSASINKKRRRFRFNAKIKFKENGRSKLLGSVQEVTDSYNQQQKIQGLVEEVTLQKDELEKKSNDLERSNKELEQFAYVASHDLQEPLRMVGNFVQLLEEEYAEQIDEDGKMYIQYAVDGVTRMSGLIEDLLGYSRVGRAEMKLKKIKPRMILSQKTRDLSVKIKEKQAVVEIQNLPEYITAEPNLLGLIFYNLINNGLKFNKNATPKIIIDSDENNKEWIFSIRDNGIGISKENQEKIFEIFKRLHRKEEYKGTGIGLAMVKRIVEKHHGTIWLDSEKGKGTTFYFTIKKPQNDDNFDRK